MKKHLMMLAALLLVVAIAMPALAEVQFKYGGQFRARWLSDNNVYDGTNSMGNYQVKSQLGYNFNDDDNRNFIDQRMRVYFSFIASQNLQAVVRLEMGDTTWGDSGQAMGSTGSSKYTESGRMGADGVCVELKNAYLQFNIPYTPSTAVIGIQGIALLDSWMIDDDFSAAVLVTKLDPFKVTLGYIAAQNSGTSLTTAQSGYTNPGMAWTDASRSVQDWALAVDYKNGPWAASLIGIYMNAHNTAFALDPNTLFSPVSVSSASSADAFGVTRWGPTNITGSSGYFGNIDTWMFPTWSTTSVINANTKETKLYSAGIENNQMFDLGFNLSYKIDWLSAYVNFVRNFGSYDVLPYLVSTTKTVTDPDTGVKTSSVTANGSRTSDPKLWSGNYNGWMIDAGTSYFCGPYTFNVGGFYTSGQKLSPVAVTDSAGKVVGYEFANNLYNENQQNTDFFTYPGTTSKYFSEIIGGGVLGDDTYAYRGYGESSVGAQAGNGTQRTMYWRGYAFPSNLWTVSAGAAWQVAEKTKISASYWYFGTPEKVPVKADANKVKAGVSDPFDYSNSIGNEFDLYIDQGIVDGLNLTIVGAYLIANDAFCPVPATNSYKYTENLADNAYEIGARLQWNF